MRVYDDVDFANLPNEVKPLFESASQQSFFNHAGWFNLIAQFGHESDWKPVLLTDDAASVGIVVQTSQEAAILSSYTNIYSCEYGPLQISPDATSSVEYLATEITAFAKQKTQIRLEGIPSKNTAVEQISAGFTRGGFFAEPFFRWAHCFENVSGQTFEGFLASRPSNLINTWKRRTAALKKSRVTYFFIINSAMSVELFIEQYEAVQKGSWKAAEPLPLFIPALIRFAASIGALRYGVLTVDNAPVAAQFWIVWNKKALIFKLVHASEFEKFSPGTLLTMHMIENIMANDKPDEISFGRGDDGYKKLWVSSREDYWGIDAANLHTMRGLALAARMKLGKTRRLFLNR